MLDKLPKPTRDELLRLLRLLEKNCWPFDEDSNPIDPASDDAAIGVMAGHGKADALLLAYIDDPDVTAAFRAIEKWYA